LTIHGESLQRIDPGGLDGLENCFSMEFAITGTRVEEIPSRICDLLHTGAWTKMDLSFNRMSALDYSTLYPNKTTWYSRGTKILEGEIPCGDFTIPFPCISSLTHYFLLDGIEEEQVSCTMIVFTWGV